MSSIRRRRNASVSAARAIPLLSLIRIFLEILIQTVKRLEPEEIAMKIRHFDQEVCTEVFLSELKPVLPNPEQVYRTHHVFRLIQSNLLMIGRQTERIPER